MLFRIEALSQLRKLVDLHPECDLAQRQWNALETRLSASAAALADRVRTLRDAALKTPQSPAAQQRFSEAMGHVELDLAKAYAFFDTYMDVLSQRRIPALGAQLAGCDALAYDAMCRDHVSLRSIEPPLVYCDRGFGAAIMRESVKLPDGSFNPMPLIQIPYSRLTEKYNLTSVLHEAGHQALQRLGLVEPLARALSEACAGATAQRTVPDLYGLWSFEIGPDFWAFCLAGVAEASAVRELFALPLQHATRISTIDPHPPPYLRALLAFSWCRKAWGRGVWDAWEAQWRSDYDLRRIPADSRRLLDEAVRLIPSVNAALFDHRFPALRNRRLTDLFDLEATSPGRISGFAKTASQGVLRLRGLRPCTQLAVFGDLRSRYPMPSAALDRLMTDWLVRLGLARLAPNPRRVPCPTNP